MLETFVLYFIRNKSFGRLCTLITVYEKPHFLEEKYGWIWHLSISLLKAGLNDLLSFMICLRGNYLLGDTNQAHSTCMPTASK